jgi:hypothetical protein
VNAWRGTVERLRRASPAYEREFCYSPKRRPNCT